MSLGYSVDVKINAPFNEQNIRSLLERGINLKFTYYKFMHYKEELSIAEAIHLAYNGDPEYDIHCLSTKIEKDYINLHFINDDGLIDVMISGISYEAVRKFKNNIEGVDIAKFAQILLELTQDFQVLTININED